MSDADKPEIQLLSNVVLCASDKVALTRYEQSDERWWLPGAELKAYEHPEEVLARALADLKLPDAMLKAARLHHVESFRGRRGWHVMFNYRLDVTAGEVRHQDYQWFEAKALPEMAHGAWEKAVVKKCLAN